VPRRNAEKATGTSLSFTPVTLTSRRRATPVVRRSVSISSTLRRVSPLTMSAHGRPIQWLESLAMGVVALCATLWITPFSSMTRAMSLASETKASASSSAHPDRGPRSAGSGARRVTVSVLRLGHQAVI
jgi:hypothetical protein